MVVGKKLVVAHVQIIVLTRLGAGCGVLYVTNSATLQTYFDKKRTLATGLATVGMSLGSAIIPPLTKLLIDVYTWRGAAMILGGISLQSTWLSMLLRPKSVKRDVISAHETNVDHKTNKFHADIAKRLNLRLLCNVKYVIFGLGGMMLQLGYFMFLLHTVNKGLDCGLTPYQASMIPAASGIVNIIGRPLLGVLSTLVKPRNLLVLALATMLQGVAIALFGAMHSFSMLLVFVVLSGLAMGEFFLVAPPTHSCSHCRS